MFLTRIIDQAGSRFRVNEASQISERYSVQINESGHEAKQIGNVRSDVPHDD